MVEPSQCTGCRTCEMACSLYHEGQCSPVLSRMRIIKYEHLGKNFPSVCSQCSKPQCLKVCDQGAITIDEKTNAVAIDQSICTGCRSCLTICPHIGFHPLKRVAFKCDLCQGSPQCARFCPSGALIFSGLNEHLMAKQRALAEKTILATKE